MKTWKQVLSFESPNWADEAPGYSYGLYYDEQSWDEIATYLLDCGFTHAEVKRMLLSKHMRWADDALTHEPTGNVDRRVTPQEKRDGARWHYLSLHDFREYFDPQADSIHREVAGWVRENSGE